MGKGNFDKSPFPTRAQVDKSRGTVGQEKGSKNTSGSGKPAGSATFSGATLVKK